MKVLVFGVQDKDALISQLSAKFPTHEFKVCAKQEDLEEDYNRPVILDTTINLDEVTLYENLDSISSAKLVAASEFLMSAKIMEKLGTMKSPKLIAIPKDYEMEDTVEEISYLLKKIHNEESD